MVKTVLLSYFDMATKEFLQTRATVIDDSDPSVDYIPYNATEVIAPDKTTWPAHTSPVFNGTSWDMVPDYRGVTFYHVLTQETKEYELGETPDTTNYVDVAPTSKGAVWNNSLHAWTRTLNSSKMQKLLELVEAYNSALYSPIDTVVKATEIETGSTVSVKASILHIPVDSMPKEPAYTSTTWNSYMRLINHAEFLVGDLQRIVYKTADDKLVWLNAVDLKIIRTTIATECSRINQRLWSLFDATMRAVTIAAVDAIVW